ncbi:hypothetical protein AAHN93_04955 [Vandammella animalimorsus]|uniref:hypothetical protein n=1 Tax=Vandammella animalimorsus TaxID=2029117 RepID=UPI0031BAA68C
MSATDPLGIAGQLQAAAQNLGYQPQAFRQQAQAPFVCEPLGVNRFISGLRGFSPSAKNRVLWTGRYF